MPKAAKLGIALAVGTLVLLEAVLQLTYCGYWLFYPRHDDAVEAGQRVVLCIGDSYTYGVGASSRDLSYPSQLQAILTEQLGPEWRVINAGWPGKNSRQILERVDANLEEYRPELVYLLIGLNDTWSLPEELILPEATVANRTAGHPREDSFRLEWRTAKLFSIFRSMLFPGATREIAEEKAAAAEGSPPAPQTMTQAPPALTEEVESATKVAMMPASEPEPSGRKRNGWESLSRRDWPKAEAEFRAVLERAEPRSDVAVSSHRGLAQVYTRWGSAEQLQAELTWLRRAYQEDPRRHVALALLQALEKAGNNEEALELSRELSGAFPDSAQVWQSYAYLSYLAGDTEEAERGIGEAVATESGQRDPWVWLTRSNIYGKSDPRRAIESGIQAFVLSGNEKNARLLRKRKGAIRDEVFAQIVAELVDDPDKRAFLETMWAGEEPGGDASPAARIYRSHVLQIHRRCQNMGARLACATYPCGAKFVETSRRIAEATGTQLIDIDAEFGRVRAKDPERELFVPDGHCNDDGYRMMAEIIARDAIDYLKSF